MSKLIKNLKPKKIYVAGHRGMVGSSIVRNLMDRGETNIITRNHKDLDLIDQRAVKNFFAKEQPDQVYIAAARVGGIYANKTYPAEFIYQNLLIASNIIDAAFRNNVKKLMFLGSSCIYPKYAPQPMNENVLLSGKLEPTNEPYAVAKIASIKLIESYNRQYSKKFLIDYRSVMPTNLYGPGDNYSKKNSHVLPSLIRKFHEAKVNSNKRVVVWGSGNPRREFLYVDDMADACIFIMNLPNKTFKKNTQPMHNHINVGSGKDLSIKELAKLIASIVGYSGKIVFDKTMPDGTPRKLLDSKLINSLGWNAAIDLEKGIKLSYNDFLKNINIYTR